MKTGLKAVLISSNGSAPSTQSAHTSRFVGIDAGAETIKLVELLREAGAIQIGRREMVEHGKKPGSTLLKTLEDWNWSNIDGAAVTGRFASQIKLPQIPTKQAQLRGYHYLFGDEAATIVNIGSHGFSVLELRANGVPMFRENSRCSQGTGNFLRQLVERFSLTVEEASSMCADIANPAPLSGRCPVILKTDMTHLANKGEDRARILAGLFDAVCENVLVLIKPSVSPNRVLLTGGVSRSPRVRRVFGESLARLGMTLVGCDETDSLCMEALGCALIAAEGSGEIPALDELLLPPRKLELEQLPSLAESLSKVRRMDTQSSSCSVSRVPQKLVLGLDIGSTGSKIVALDSTTTEVVWEAYRQTLGNPVGAAQDLIRRFTESAFACSEVVAFGATGSGREVAGSLLTSCYGKDSVFIVNEIVAHATGALHFDPRVDTIFEIGGQDAKYIRLAEGRILDCAMNEACSAGTGSFIEEQGRKFSGVEDVRQLGKAAVAAPCGVSLGQHCSVFMAEVIDEAVSAGVDQSAIISGLYDSIIKNYLNRVKGNRSVGKVIFCQGMPFSADALAAAVAHQTGSEVIVPPNPGTVGALGIALLAGRELRAASLSPLDPKKFLEAKVEQKDTFVCGSSRGCGGAGNHCRIERLRTLVCGERSNFTWGGGCSLHDKGTRKRKLPDLAPDPFREREELLQRIIAPFTTRDLARLDTLSPAPSGGEGRGEGALASADRRDDPVLGCPSPRPSPRASLRGEGEKPRIAMSDEFMLKGIFPFFAAFFHEAGYQLEIVTDAGHETLKRGIQTASVPFCAPMQLFHGITKQLLATGAEWIFVPMLRSVPRTKDQQCSVVCPIVQAAPDVVRCAVHEAARDSVAENKPRLLSPIVDFDEGNLESKEFLASCERLAEELELSESQWRSAWRSGVAAQKIFDAGCEQIGRRALDFCRTQNIVPVVVLGRSYTIYNKVLNSNVPAILREQGAIGVPGDCFPLDAGTPLFTDMYWGYGQNILRAAHQVRRTPGTYALYCSNYSCGPDSFNLHFAAYVMEGKPFAIIETDGHSGDAGTKTRVEAFLHCVEEDRRSQRADAMLNDFASAQFSGVRLDHFARNGSKETLLVPNIGPASEAVAAVFRGLGLNSECLPRVNAESLRRGRRYTSGKECLPMPLTLGSLLQRLERAKDGERFVYLMPSTNGPCRFGVYNLLNNIVLEKLGWRDRVRIWSPKDTGYFDDMPAGTEMLVFCGIVASDLLLQAKLDVRPVELERGTTSRIYARFHRELVHCIETAARGNLSLSSALWQVTSGRLFGVRNILKRAANEFAATRGTRKLPVVKLAGEIYVRGVDFSNDFVIEKLEARGLRVHLAPKTEWINYCGYTRKFDAGRNRLVDSFSDLVQRRIDNAAFAAMSAPLGWNPSPTSAEALDDAAPYVNKALKGEAVLTIGAPLHEWRHGQIDGVVNVGPLECMPTKIAEAQYHHLAEREGVLSLTLAFNGDPISTSALDNFAFEVKARFRENRRSPKPLLASRA